MWPVSHGWRRLSLLALTSASLATGRVAWGQELPRVSVTRKLAVAGVGVEPRSEDLLGLSRIKFQGLIASELSNVGYLIASPDDAAFQRGDAAPLTLTGRIKEEVCDDIAPSQCRIAVLWDLEDKKGVTVYRALTRAVDQKPTIDELRRSLIVGALHSLLQRRRFALQLIEADAGASSSPSGPLGFKQCRRPTLVLPAAARSAAASLVWVQSGSNLASGAIISSDGLILTSASSIEPSAPLRVRFAAQQTLDAEVVAIERGADVALLHVPASTDACLPIREAESLVGAEVFGVSSELSEDAAMSLAPGKLARSQASPPGAALEVEPRIAGVDGAPLLDEEGRILGVISGKAAKAGQRARAIEIGAALQALGVKAAPVSDPRLLREQRVKPAVAYVRDRDDPPFVLVKHYTYGTSATAHRVRTASIVAASLGAIGVAATWMSFRANPRMGAGEHQRTVVLNDLSWGVLGLGAVGIGASFALPEGHEVVAGHSARRQVFVTLARRSLTIGAQL